MNDILLVKYAEIHLKGLNRPYFQNLLLKRVKEAVRPFSRDVQFYDSRIFIRGIRDVDAAVERVRKVFGVHAVCPAVEMDKADFNAICAQAANLMASLNGTFKVRARRADKRYFLDSPEINARIGGFVLENHPGLKVDVHQPEHVLNVEIRDQALLYAREVPGVGGLPTGSSGKAMLMLSGGIDSPVAGYMIAKRGVVLNAVHFFSFPYTGELAREKVLSLARILAGYCGVVKTYVVSFTKLQEAIHTYCPPEYSTLVMRRLMVRITDLLAERERAAALITGESIGQVASQTMEALAVTDVMSSRPVFRPLIGFDKIEIIHLAENIGTYETSSLPYEDCCTVFTPRHPVTRPKISKVLEAEAAIPQAEALVAVAVETAEILYIGPDEADDTLSSETA
ncbi:MAG: tRNA 4-thiouridine(8) synthase ThiI [Eubacteriales bacterium]|nr:tRNA 4-thiouridine(8) synthase ThiI [Eubacteriales bacterium]